MDFYIGQDIVAIKDHSQGVFKEGEVFTIKGLKGSYCKCKKVLIDIGIFSDAHTIKCNYCGNITIKDNSTAWFSERCFAPLDTLADISELTEHLETTKPFEV